MSRTSTMQPSTLGYVYKQDMPHHLSILFRARPPLEFAEQIEKGKCKPICGYFDGYRDYFSVFEEATPEKGGEYEKPQEKKKRLKEQKLLENIKKQEEEIKKWNPYNDPNIKSKSPYSTLFVGNLNFKTDERSLKREFERFGRIASIRVVRDDKTGKSRGYAFIEFEKEHQMEKAFVEAQHRRIDGRKVFVDYERGRTKKTWLPMRLGGGYRARDGRSVNKRQNLEEEEMIKELKANRKSRSRSRDQEKTSFVAAAKKEEEEQKQEEIPREEEEDKKKKDKKKKKHKKHRKDKSKEEDYEEESGEIHEVD